MSRQLAPRTWCRDDMDRLGLPRYGADEFAKMRAELLDGAGFVLIQGFLALSGDSFDRGSAAERLRRFGAELGRLLPQNAKQETLVDVADFTDEDAFDDRGYRSPGELTPHTDPPPLIVLLCLRPALQGGTNRLVGADSIRHAIREENPNLLSLLEDGFPFFMPDEMTPGAGRVRGVMPIFLEGSGGMSCLYYRPFIERAAEVSGTPLPKQAVEALDLFDRFASDPTLQVLYTLEPGELLILNNFRVLHARDEYRDWPEKDKRRHLLRLWLDADWIPDPGPAHAGRRNPMARML